MKIYGIDYDNGEEYDDHWSGLLHDEFFDSAEKAESRIIELQKEREFEMNDRAGSQRYWNGRETWEVEIIEVK